MLESKMGKILNSCLDAGIKAVCPNIIDDELIEIKDAVIENGIEGGIKEIITSVKDFGKSALGLITGNFESIEQIELAVKNGGVIDTVSDIIDLAIDSATKNGKIDKDISTLIKKGKKAIVKDFTKSMSEDLLEEQKTLEKIEKYID